MEGAVKLAAVAVTAAVLSGVLRKNTPELALLLVLAVQASSVRPNSASSRAASSARASGAAAPVSSARTGSHRPSPSGSQVTRTAQDSPSPAALSTIYAAYRSSMMVFIPMFTCSSNSSSRRSTPAR